MEQESGDEERMNPPGEELPAADRFRVSEELDGRTVEVLLMRRTGRGRDHAAKLLRQGRVWVEGEPVAPKTLLFAGTELVVTPGGSGEKQILPNRRLRLHILHRDDHLLVLRKPVGLVMHPGPGHGTNTLLHAVMALAEAPLRALGPERTYGLVHRLDRGTSGVVVVALSELAYDCLARQFEDRTVKKEYVAIVHGVPAEREGTIRGPVGGKDAESDYRVEEVRRGEAGVASRLTVFPRTGRTHQIRIHLASLSCPVVGDRRYGREKDDLAAALYLPHFALHAQTLGLLHPETGEAIRFEAALPGSLRRAWRKYGASR